MIFPDYKETGVIYHIVTLKDLEKTLKYGIEYDDKWTYQTKYDGFHQWIDQEKPESIPIWVIRSRAIFGSMNYPNSHHFHSHSAILSIKIDQKKCWIANENCANQLYEPYILQNIKGFDECKCYLEGEGKDLLKKYWETSLSFEENLRVRMDLREGYDGEVLIQHPIKPKDIKVLYIVSDHRKMDILSWKERFCKKRGS